MKAKPSPRHSAIEACAQMASSFMVDTKKPVTRLTDVIDADSPAGRLATLALAAVSEEDRPINERWAAAEQELQEGWTPAGEL